MAEFYIVHHSILPSCIEKVIAVKDYLQKSQDATISSACSKFALSRSAYYKYKDLVYPINQQQSRKALIVMTLNHQKGTLSQVLNLLSNIDANILTISQALPIHETANVNISLDILNVCIPIEEMIKSISVLPGVIEANLVNLE